MAVTIEAGVCRECGEIFERKVGGKGRPQRFCSPRCRDKHKRPVELERKRKQRAQGIASSTRIVTSPRKAPQPEERHVPIVRPAGDPPVRADGTCARPGCSKPLPRSKQARKYAGAQLDDDPFCSTRCCRRFYGCELAGDPDDEAFERMSEAGKKSAARLREAAA